MAYVGPILSHVGLVGGHVGAILGLRETYVGQFLGPSLRAKNSVIFSAVSAKSKLQGTDKKWVPTNTQLKHVTVYLLSLFDTALF